MFVSDMEADFSPFKILRVLGACAEIFRPEKNHGRRFFSDGTSLPNQPEKKTSNWKPWTTRPILVGES